MASIRFKSRTSLLPVDALRELRSLTTASVAELRLRAERGEPLLEFRVFCHPWDETKRSIRRVLELIENGRLPLLIFEFRGSAGGFPAREEELAPTTLRQRFETWKQIANEAQMLTELEEGYIKSPDEFVPNEDDDA